MGYQDIMMISTIIVAVAFVSLILQFVIGAILANKKGRSIGWWLVGVFLLGWIAVIILAFLPSLKPSKHLSEPSYKPSTTWSEYISSSCKRCGAKIKPSLSYCEKCGYPTKTKIE